MPLGKLYTQLHSDAGPPAALSPAVLSQIWALTFEGHRLDTPLGVYAQCGCVCCRIRHLMDGGTIEPKPHIEPIGEANVPGERGGVQNG
jgi:hypothetical protein